MSLDRRSPVLLVLSLAGVGALGPLTVPGVAFAQEPSQVVGDWTGSLELPGGATLELSFHLRAEEGGGLGATLDVPAQGAMAVPMGELSFAADSLRIRAPALGASFEGVRTAPDTVEGEWSQGGAVLPLTLVRQAEEASGPARPQRPVPPFPYEVEEVRFPNPEAGIELAGTLTLPPGEGPWPAVVLISGSGPQDRDETVFGHKPFAVLADHLTRRGIAVLRYVALGLRAANRVRKHARESIDTRRDMPRHIRIVLSELGGRIEYEAASPPLRTSRFNGDRSQCLLDKSHPRRG